MNKHNIIKLEEYLKDKKQVQFEQICFGMLDKVGSKISDLQDYTIRFKEHLCKMTRQDLIKSSFAADIAQQIDLICMKASAYIARLEHK